MAMYVMKGDKKLGPLNLKEIKTMLVKGEISEDDTAYLDSIDEECKVKQLPGVFGRERGFRNTDEIGLYRNSEEDQLALYDIEYAGVFRRLIAMVLDMIVLACLPAVVLAGVAFLGGDPFKWAWLAYVLGAIELLYFPLLEGSSLRGTLGKRLMKVVVCDFEGEPIGMKAAFIRLLGRFLSVLTMGVGYVMVFLTDRHQTLHDKLSDAIVVIDD